VRIQAIGHGLNSRNAFRAAVAQGANTPLVARSTEVLKDQGQALREAGLLAEAVRLDVADSESIESVAAACGHVDILVNVVGANIRKRFREYSPEQHQRILQGVVDLT